MSTNLLSIETLAERLPVKARLIGVDLGTKTIGLALSDVERRVATPLGVVQRTRFAKDAEALSARIREFDAFALVVGLPLNMDGGAARASRRRALSCATSPVSIPRRSSSGTSACRPRRSSAR